MSAGRLIICPTPIGNLEDVTLRVSRRSAKPTSSPARTPVTVACC